MFTLHLHDYDIFIGGSDGSGLIALQQLVERGNYTKITVLTDENTTRCCLPVLLSKSNFEASSIEIPSGEEHKSLDTCKFIWQEMIKLGLDRHSLLINLGGGVIGDMGGFCAATYLRGIDFIQIPTTLLSQVDASIGGKLGIDFQYLKNNIGVFKNPKAVLIEPVFLKTLPVGEVRSGFAEIIKHALIADPVLWERLLAIKDLNKVNWPDLLVPSLSIKQQIVEEDPFEKGLRKALNFGHTIGHAVESYSFKTQHPLLHGEAIAIGLICETFLSCKIAGLPSSDLENTARFIRYFYESYPLNKSSFPELLSLMKKDKKNEGGRINFTLINPIGKALINQSCEEGLIMQSLEYYLDGA